MCQCNDGVLVSVVIPLYNKAPYIKRAIDSVLNQTVQNFEIIIVGGRSTDGGEEIVQTYTDSRIKLVMEIGKGVSAARNQGINSSNGSLVAFLDADDFWPTNYIEGILNLKSLYPNAGLYATGFKLVSASGEKSVCYSCLPEGYCGIIPSYFQAIVYEGRDLLATSSITIPKTTFKNVGLFNEFSSYNEDSELVGRIALTYSIAIDTRIVVSYTIDCENSLSKNPPSQYKHPFIVVIEQIPDVELVCRDDYKYIILYLDKLYFSSAMINLWTYDDELYHYHISKVKMRKLSLSRLGMTVISKIPIGVRKSDIFKYTIYYLKRFVC